MNGSRTAKVRLRFALLANRLEDVGRDLLILGFLMPEQAEIDFAMGFRAIDRRSLPGYVLLKFLPSMYLV